jgi:hypothetical protein
MAAQWLEADTVAIRRALRLVDASARGERGADTALTQLEYRLGLTPEARRYLQWEARPMTTPAPVVALAPPSKRVAEVGNPDPRVPIPWRACR